MIGIILWAILILFIVICACPGFITAVIVSYAIVLSVYGLVYWIKDGCKLPSKKRKNEDQSGIDTIVRQDRESAIDEWERKWRRKHPSRKDR